MYDLNQQEQQYIYILIYDDLNNAKKANQNTI